MEATVKNRLKEILDERGIKYGWFANKIGISYSTLSNLTQNKFNTSLLVALRIASELELRVEDIFYLENVA
jgi:DNA-binding XRE family transcriptional regulator